MRAAAAYSITSAVRFVDQHPTSASSIVLKEGGKCRKFVPYSGTRDKTPKTGPADERVIPSYGFTRACHQLSQTTLATSWTAARKFRAVFS